MINILTAKEARNKIKGTFLLIHGAGVGGWVFRDVALLLRMYGYEVHTPTLSGLADRSHIPLENINLSTHIEDIVEYIRFYGLKDVILVAHSYGGAVACGVVDKIPELIKLQIYIDSFFLENGETILDLFPKERSSRLVALAQNEGNGIFLPRKLFGKESYLIGDMPFKPYIEVMEIKNENKVPGAYIDCLVPHHFEHLVETKKLMKKRVVNRNWKYFTLDSDHVPMTKSPERENLVDLLLKIVK